MKDIKQALTEGTVSENQSEDLTYKAFRTYHTEDDFSGAGEIFGEVFGNDLGPCLSEFIYGVGEACRQNGNWDEYDFLNKLRIEIDKNIK